MPKGIYIRTEKNKINLSNARSLGLQNGSIKVWNKGKKIHYSVWNKGKTGLQVSTRKGTKRPEFSGENHTRWIKDRTLLTKKQERNDSAYKEWRKNVWIRDNFKCKILNQDCRGRLQAHHILGWSSHPELRYQINNGITLCQAHHPRKRAEAKQLNPYFQDLILAKR